MGQATGIDSSVEPHSACQHWGKKKTAELRMHARCQGGHGQRVLLHLEGESGLGRLLLLQPCFAGLSGLTAGGRNAQRQ